MDGGRLAYHKEENASLPVSSNVMSGASVT